MIAITAQTGFDYTEPIPVDSVIEPEENEERSSFAELLAGLLQNTQSEKLPVIETESGFDILALDKSKNANMILTGLDISAEKTGINIKEFSDIDLSDSAIEKEYQKILDMDHLLNSSFNMENFNDDNIDIDVKTLDRLADITSSLKNKSSQKDNLEASSASQVFSGLESNEKRDIEDALFAAERKKRITGEKTEVNPASKDKVESSFTKNTTEDNSAFFTSRDDNKMQNTGRLDVRSRRDRVSLEVLDKRTITNTPAGTERGFALAETPVSRVSGQAGTQEITLDLRLPDAGQSSQAQTTWETKAGTALENMLARELHQNFNGDIVRHASIALRDGGAGTIKINLHPETLGKVKVHLELTENKITGRIVVESQEALNAFRKELDALEQAFKDSGFADASLDLSLAADGFGADQEFNEGSFTSQMIASRYEDSPGNAEQEASLDIFLKRGTGSINMLA
ncbi:MAG: flagellar hook-length control protein FliK [Treponema sp.]|nr:flagellar hook-length control protein FliK [Treponema sp.]